MAKPLKVYYCCDCGCRMPLYYKKDAPYRDEAWHHCYACNSTNLESQVEQWDYYREKIAKNAVTRMQLDNLKHSAKQYSGYLPQNPAESTSRHYNGSDQYSGNCPF